MTLSISCLLISLLVTRAVIWTVESLLNISLEKCPSTVARDFGKVKWVRLIVMRVNLKVLERFDPLRYCGWQGG